MQYEYLPTYHLRSTSYEPGLRRWYNFMIIDLITAFNLQPTAHQTVAI